MDAVKRIQVKLSANRSWVWAALVVASVLALACSCVPAETPEATSTPMATPSEEQASAPDPEPSPAPERQPTAVRADTPAPVPTPAPERQPTAVRVESAPAPVPTPSPTQIPVEIVWTPSVGEWFEPGPDIVYTTVMVPVPEDDPVLLKYLVDGISGIEGSSGPSYGPASLEELILTADVIARVSFASKRTSVSQRPHAEWQIWGALLEFRFRVHEYLKGTGPSEIGGRVYIEYYGSDGEAQARQGVAQIGDAHDSRWDAREAIVFLRSDDPDNPDVPEFPSGSDQYWFGYMALPSVNYGLREAYTVASVYREPWLSIS